MTDLKEKISAGQLLTRIIFELVGSPKEHVEETIKEYVKKIKKAENMEVIKEDLVEAERKDQYWATFAELEIVIKDIPTLVGLCLDYMPASIEILEPENVTLKNHYVSDWMNDMLARLHEVDLLIKNSNAENNMLKENASSLFRNLVILSLDASPKTIEDLGKHIGIPHAQLELLIEPLIEKGLIEKKDNKYFKKT